MRVNVCEVRLGEEGRSHLQNLLRCSGQKGCEACGTRKRREGSEEGSADCHRDLTSGSSCAAADGD